MKKLIAIPTFDKNGILDGMEVIDRIYVRDEVSIDGERLNPRAFCPHLKTRQAFLAVFRKF